MNDRDAGASFFSVYKKDGSDDRNREITRTDIQASVPLLRRCDNDAAGVQLDAQSITLLFERQIRIRSHFDARTVH